MTAVVIPRHFWIICEYVFGSTGFRLGDGGIMTADAPLHTLAAAFSQQMKYREKLGRLPYLPLKLFVAVAGCCNRATVRTLGEWETRCR